VGDFLESTGLPNIWDGNSEIVDGNNIIANGGESKESTTASDAVINIVMIDGIRQFEDGYVPTSAKWYLNPTNPDYRYAGDIGSGIYKIRIAEQVCEVFCDMRTDGGGWMYVATGTSTSFDYLGQFGDTSDIKKNFYTDEAFGIGWGSNSGADTVFQTYNIPFSEVKCKISGEYDNPETGTGYLNFYTSSSGNVLKFEDNSYNGNDGQTLIVDGVELITNSQQNLVKYEIHSAPPDAPGDINSLTIKMRGDANLPYCRRFIYMLAVR
jgi:hypothetical protein